jgi:hypothetical protein
LPRDFLVAELRLEVAMSLFEQDMYRLRESLAGPTGFASILALTFAPLGRHAP